MHGYNFTEPTRKVLALSRQEAHRLGHEYVGTEHLLLGLLRESESVAIAALRALNIDLEAIRGVIEKAAHPGTHAADKFGALPYTSRAKKSLELAMAEAKEFGRADHVGPEHILIGLLREEKGIAGQVLADAGVALPTLRARVLDLLGPNAGDPPTSGGRATPTA